MINYLPRCSYHRLYSQFWDIWGWSWLQTDRQTNRLPDKFFDIWVGRFFLSVKFATSLLLLLAEDKFCLLPCFFVLSFRCSDPVQYKNLAKQMQPNEGDQKLFWSKIIFGHITFYFQNYFYKSVLLRVVLWTFARRLNFTP